MPTMNRRSVRAVSARAWLALVVVAVLFASIDGGGAAAGSEEVRALWVLRTTLTSPASIETMVRTARASGFNTLLVQVRGRGDAYFNGGLEPRAAQLSTQPARFDPLATTITAARAEGLKVHAWVSVNLVSSASELPVAREHIIYRHPEWLMVPRSVGLELATIDPQNPAYVGKIARWVRGRSEEVEGLYLSPISRAAADYTISVIADLAARYAIDGVHLDYARFPSAEFDYSVPAIAEFRAEIADDVDAAVRQRLDSAASVDPFAWPDALADRWATFRRARMTTLVMRLGAALRARRPGVVLSSSVVADEADAFSRRLQDWAAWAERRLIDVICPMAYTPDAGVFAQQVTAARDIAGASAVWAGIGAYRLTPYRTTENIAAARRLGVAGVALFSYDTPSVELDERREVLARIARALLPESTPSFSGSR
jgi:uncharacterized lipoprotein YddW (UPF0748 family)